MSFVTLQVFFSVNGGRNTLICLKTMTKMGVGAEPRIKGDLGYIKVGGFKKGSCPFNTLIYKVFLKGYTHLLMEGSRKTAS